MRHFRAEGEDINLQDEHKATYQQKISTALKSITSLLPFVEFTVNYGFAIENVWVTMLMITHKTPDVVDSFIWILPIVIAIFIRPYIVRYVHQLRYKVHREINMVSLFLVIGSIGCFLVGESCRHEKKSEMVRRIIQCIIGWTLMDLSFQFCQYFAEKIQESSKEIAKGLQKTDKKKAQNQIEGQTLSKRQNFEFYGLFLGYIVSLLICWITHGRTVKQFYKCCRYAYWTVAGLSFITGIRLYIESHLNLPQQTIEQSPKLHKDGFKVSTKLSYYLPGLQQLLNADLRTIVLLLLHVVILFLNDVIMIYTTMWFSQPAEIQYKRHGQALISGLQYGSIALLVYTVLDNLKITKKPVSSIVYLQITMTLVIIISVFCFYLYNYVTFSLMAVSISILNQLYRHSIFNIQFEENPVFERCIQIVERLQKIYVLAVMPPIVMLGLERNDIQDCLVWAAGMASIGVCACYLIRKSRQGASQSTIPLQTIKVSKVE